MGSYAVMGRNILKNSTGHPFHNRNTNQRPLEPFQNRSNQLNNHPHIPRSFNHNAFLTKSQRFKKQLLQSIDLTLTQIQQWYPDEDSSADEMDWQPEAEIIIRRPAQSIVDAVPAGRINLVSAWQPKTLKGSSVFDCASLEKGHMNLVAPLGPRATRRASLGNAFVSTWGQRMEKEMNRDNLISVPRSCTYAVPTTCRKLSDLR